VDAVTLSNDCCGPAAAAAGTAGRDECPASSPPDVLAILVRLSIEGTTPQRMIRQPPGAGQ